MAQAFEPVSLALASTKFSAVAPYIRDEQYTLRDLGRLRGRSLAWTLFAGLTSLLGVGAAVLLFVTRTPYDADDTVTGAMIVGLPSLALFLVVLNAFVRMRSFSGQFPELAAFDNRAPILYLRNFANENPDVAMDTGLPLSTKASFEHLIGTYFWNFGRVVALGDPLQRRPSGSVSRFFVTDEGWRASVESVMAQSQAIIIHYGAGANVDWEVDQSERFAETPRLVILNVNREPGMKRIADVPAPAALKPVFEKSKRRLPSGDALMLGVIRERKCDVVLVGDASAQSLGRMLNRFRRSFKARPSREQLPPDVLKLRNTLHNLTYRPVLVALVGPAAILLVLAAAMLAPGLMTY